MSGGQAPLRVGVVGTGAISQIVHVPIFSEREDVEVVAMADRLLLHAESLSVTHPATGEQMMFESPSPF